MSNPVLILTHNNLELTKKCVESVQNQDMDTRIYVFDNHSTDGTIEWGTHAAVNGNFEHQSTLKEFWQSEENHGVSRGWNTILDYLFCKIHTNIDHVLVLNNDVILHKNLYCQLLSCQVPFVSATETTNLSDLEKEWPYLEFGSGPQFSCFLIRKSAWQKIGPFDETMQSWCSDCDYHLRAHRLGIPLLCSPVRYYHERSSTIKTAPLRERRILELQADVDRQVFLEKWGFEVASPAYTAMFDTKYFGIDSNDADRRTTSQVGLREG